MVLPRLDEEPDVWFATVARPERMGAVIDPVQPGPSGSEPLTQGAMNPREVEPAEAAERNPSLIGDHHHQHATLVEQPDPFHRAVEQF